MADTILMIVAMATLCFMATCLLLVFMMYKRKEEKEELNAEEDAELIEKIAKEQEKKQQAWDDMMAYTGAPKAKGGDDW